MELLYKRKRDILFYMIKPQQEGVNERFNNEEE